MIPWRRAWQPTPVFLPGKSHGQRSPTGYSHGIAKSQTRLSVWAHTHRLLTVILKIKNNFFVSLSGLHSFMLAALLSPTRALQTLVSSQVFLGLLGSDWLACPTSAPRSVIGWWLSPTHSNGLNLGERFLKFPKGRVGSGLFSLEAWDMTTPFSTLAVSGQGGTSTWASQHERKVFPHYLWSLDLFSS